MGQHLDKAARGAYDAIVYIDGSEVVAEDADGRKIASGVAGIADNVIINAAIIASTHRVLLEKNSYNISSSIVATNKVDFELDLGGSTLVWIGTPYPTSYRGNYTKVNVICLWGVRSGIVNGIIDCANVESSNGVYVFAYSDPSGAIVSRQNYIRMLEVKNANTLRGASPSINYGGNGIVIYNGIDCLVEHNYIHDCTVGIMCRGTYTEDAFTPTIDPINTIEDNRIENCVVQSERWLGIGIYVYDSPGTKISKNVVNDCTFGLYVGESHVHDRDYIIHMNTVSNSFFSGIHAAGHLHNSVISKNICHHNGLSGIVLGYGSVVSSNICYNNGQNTNVCTNETSGAGIEVYPGFTSTAINNILIGNRCFDDQSSPTQLFGYSEEYPITSPGNMLFDNNFGTCRIFNSSVTVRNSIRVTSNTNVNFNTDYIIASPYTFELTLPSETYVGAKIGMFGNGTGSWKLVQSLYDTIYIDGISTTPGATGYVSGGVNSVLELMCIQAKYHTRSSKMSLTNVSSNANGGTLDWTDLGNMIAGYDKYTTAASTVPITTYRIVATNLGFSIPSTATIDGVVVTIYRKASHEDIADYVIDSEIKLISGGVIGTSNLASPDKWQSEVTTRTTAKTYGGPANQWGELLTYSIINGSDFGVAFAASIQSSGENVIAYVDFVYITIHYSIGTNKYRATRHAGNITCDNGLSFNNESFGASTGTGSEQTIAHGLAAIPTGCKAWIKYLVGTRYITEMVPFDATNIYPTVETGVAYEWRIE